MNASYFVIAARTGGAGLGGISLFFVEAGTAGFSRTAIERKTFGKPLIKHQVIRHKIADMSSRIDAMEGLLNQICWCVNLKTAVNRSNWKRLSDAPGGRWVGHAHEFSECAGEDGA